MGMLDGRKLRGNFRVKCRVKGKREEALEAVELDGILFVPQHRIILHTETCYSFNMWFLPIVVSIELGGFYS